MAARSIPKQGNPTRQIRNHSRDSWSRCEAPSMLYDARSIPKRPVTPVDSIAKVSDVRESGRSHFKKDILHKLDNKGLELPHESYVAVVQVAKYVFLAVMLPVYFCCYGLPRWVLATAVPHIFDSLKAQTFQVGRFVTERAKQVVDLMKGLMDQLIGDAMRMARDKGKNLWKRFTDKYSSASQKLRQAIRILNQPFEFMKQMIVRYARDRYAAAEEKVRALNAWIIKKGSSFGMQVADKAISGFQAADQYALTPFMRTVFRPFQWLNRVVQRTKAAILKALNHIKLHMQKRFAPVITLIQWAVHAVKEPVSQWLKSKKEMLLRYYQRFKKAVLDPAFSALRIVVSAVSVRIGSYLSVFKKILKMVWSIVQSIGQLIWRLTSKKTKEKILRWKKRIVQCASVLQSILRGIAFAGFKCLQLGKSGCNAIKRVLMAIVTFSKLLLRVAFNLLKALPRKILPLSVAVVKVFVFLAARVLFVGQILLAIIWLAFSDCLQLVREFENGSAQTKSA